MDSATIKNDPVAGSKGAKPVVNARLVRTLTEMILALLICIIVLEICFAFAGLGEQDFLRPHPVNGFEAMPDKNITFRREGFSRTRFNSHGMCDKPRTLDKQRGTVRIAVVGDSIVEALQVEHEERMCSILEGKLNQKFKSPFEVLNFGMSASNIGQTFLRLQNKVIEFHPDIVVLFFPHHSTYDVIPQPNEIFPKICRPYFLISKDGLVADYTIMNHWLETKEGKRILATEWLREHSHIWGVIGSLSVQFTRSLGHVFDSASAADLQKHATKMESSSQATRVPASLINNANADRCIKFYYPIVDALLVKMARLCKEHQVQFVIAYLPFEADSAARLERNLLGRTCARAGIKFLDLGAAIVEKHYDKKESLYYQCHFSKYGNKVLADALRAELLRSGSLQKLY
ncbi:MAG: SGNH/GDSL hydrolase family protein [Candidatus Obscuribacterales bacterium]|jgi:hypothetical protein|nr:SGNH/GDSL hydrolase family protein [Candidatus Obscuribacterales bacterium]